MNENKHFSILLIKLIRTQSQLCTLNNNPRLNLNNIIDISVYCNFEKPLIPVGIILFTVLVFFFGREIPSVTLFYNNNNVEEVMQNRNCVY